MTAVDHALYAALWLSFGLGHSLLAGSTLRRIFGRADRLAYNAIAVIHIAAVWGIGKFVLAADTAAFDRPLALQIGQGALALAGLVILAVALRGYDGRRLIGLAQWREPAAATTLEPLRTTGLNAYVRHPLYFGAILLLVGLIADPFSAATALWASLYLWLGAAMEERRLASAYGDDYAAYRARTPMLFPLRPFTPATPPAD